LQHEYNPDAYDDFDSYTYEGNSENAARLSIMDKVCRELPSAVEGAPSAVWRKFTSAKVKHATKATRLGSNPRLCTDPASPWLQDLENDRDLLVGALQGGKLLDEGSKSYPIFVGRVFLRSGVHPCQCGPDLEADTDSRNSLCAKKGFVLTNHEGDAIRLYQEPFEVLFVEKKMELRWKKKKPWVNPPCAVIAGMDAIGRFGKNSEGSQTWVPTESARPLWVARVFVKGEVLIGKAAPHISNGNVALVPCKVTGKELHVNDFEILVASKLDGPERGVNPADWDPQYGPDLRDPLQ